MIFVPDQTFTCPRCGAPGVVRCGEATYSCVCRFNLNQQATEKSAVLVKNSYCTDCGGINEHYDHCLTKTGDHETGGSHDA